MARVGAGRQDEERQPGAELVVQRTAAEQPAMGEQHAGPALLVAAAAGDHRRGADLDPQNQVEGVELRPLGLLDPCPGRAPGLRSTAPGCRSCATLT